MDWFRRLEGGHGTDEWATNKHTHAITPAALRANACDTNIRVVELPHTTSLTEFNQTYIHKSEVLCLGPVLRRWDVSKCLADQRFLQRIIPIDSEKFVLLGLTVIMCQLFLPPSRRKTFRLYHVKLNSANGCSCPMLCSSETRLAPGGLVLWSVAVLVLCSCDNVVRSKRKINLPNFLLRDIYL